MGMKMLRDEKTQARSLGSKPVQVLAIIFALHFLTGCGSPLAGDQPGATDVSTSVTSASVNSLSLLTVAPKASALTFNGVLSLSVTGGIAPYIYSILQGGGSIASNGTSGATYVAGTTAATVVVGVTDATGSATTATIVVAASKATN